MCIVNTKGCAYINVTLKARSHNYRCRHELWGLHITSLCLWTLLSSIQCSRVILSSLRLYNIFPHCLIKVKWSRYRPRVAQRVGRGIALLFHDHGTRRRWVVSSTPRSHFYPRERPGAHITGSWVGPRASLDGRKISSPPEFDLGPWWTARFSGKVYWTQNVCFDLLCKSMWNILHSKKNSARCDHKYSSVCV